MDDEIERLVVSVRADTAGFASDVSAMKAELEGPLVEGAGRAGEAIERTFARAIRTGKLGFDDMKRIILALIQDMAAIPAGASAGGGGGMLSNIFGAIGGLFGLPGRATGGPVAGGKPYMVGERGPELFVPTSSGRVETLGLAPGRAVNITVNVNAPSDGGRPEMVKTGQQMARAVRRALEQAGG